MNRGEAFPALTADEYKGILERWQEPHRRWHGLSHLVILLQNIQDDDELLEEDREMLRYVALFHDAIYDPLSPENEEKSAKMAAYYLHEYPRREEVIAAILATKTHQSQDRLPRKFNAWDCAILRETDWDKLTFYEEAVAFEFKDVDPETYRRERAKFLRKAAQDYDNLLLARLAGEVEHGRASD
jgi:predicted metal-dependent HD superfamily phosphohydrolase